MTYMLTRRLRLAPGQTGASLKWAQDVTERVAQVSGLPVRLQQQVFSPQVGTLAWQVFAPNLATFEQLFDKINDDPSVVKILDSGAQYLLGGMQGEGISDHLSNILQGNFEEHGGHQLRGGPEYQTWVHAIMAPGNFAKSTQVGMDLARTATKVTGSPTLFAVDQTGYYGSVQWITSYTEIREMENAQRLLSENPEWTQMLDNEASTSFMDQPFSARQEIYRRVLS